MGLSEKFVDTVELYFKYGAIQLRTEIIYFLGFIK